jgi:hypothetical protein
VTTSRAFALADVERTLGCRRSEETATQLGIAVRTVHRLRALGLTETMADHYACRAHVHPGNVWREWWL